MGVIVLGLSHKTAPIELREHLVVPKEKLEDALQDLKKKKELLESVILSTCNRLEIYARPAKKGNEALTSLRVFFERLYSHPKLKQALYQFEADQAVRHLFRVAAGLDSLVLGETEVLGQVKAAYQFAQEFGSTGKITNVLFQRALYVGKHVRTQSEISDGASSIGSVAVRLAERIFGELKNHRVVLLGAGDIAEATARALLSQKTRHLTVLNRTLAKAEQLAELLNGTAGSLDLLEQELQMADIVICSLAVQKPIINIKTVESVMKVRRQKSLYFIDIGLPRNVQPEVNNVDNVYLYNIDDLQSIVNESLSKRKGAITKAENMVSDLAEEFSGWITSTLQGKQVALKHHHDRQ